MHLDIQQVLTQIVAFLIVLAILKRFAWKPLLSIMEERKHKIQEEFNSIEKKKKEANDLLIVYNDKLHAINQLAKEKMQEAIEAGKVVAEEIRKDAHKQAKAIIHKANAQVDKEVAKAKVQLQQDLVNAIIDLTEKMIRKNLDRKDQEKLVSRFIEQEILND